VEIYVRVALILPIFVFGTIILLDWAGDLSFSKKQPASKSLRWKRIVWGSMAGMAIWLCVIWGFFVGPGKPFQ
jgi:hypothetical protein